MDVWPALLLSLGILMLSAVQVSTAELSTVQDDMTVVSAIVDVKHALKRFGKVQESAMELSRQDHDAVLGFAEILNTSLSAHGDTLVRLGEQLRRPPQLHGENCTASLGSFSDAVATLSQVNVDLNSKLADKDQKVKTLTQENAHLRNQVNATEEKFKSFLLSAGYEHHPGFGFYKYFSQAQAQSWDEAVQTCKSWGSHLGIANSKDEARVYAAIIARHPTVAGAYSPYHFHSGYKEVGNTGQYQTLDGVPLSEAGYAEWASGQPSHDHERCGSINRDAELDDAPCFMLFAFICELEYP